MSSVFYSQWNGKEFGPVSALELFEDRTVTDDSLVRIGANGDWIRFHQLKTDPDFLGQVEVEFDVRLENRWAEFENRLAHRRAEFEADLKKRRAEFEAEQRRQNVRERARLKQEQHQFDVSKTEQASTNDGKCSCGSRKRLIVTDCGVNRWDVIGAA